MAGTSLAGIPADYARDVDTIGQGLTGYKRRLPAATGELYVQYFHNLVWDGQSLGEAEKPDTAPRFDTFETYAAYLRDTAEQLATNMNNRARAHAVTPLVTVSQGYDSSAAAVVARLAGCRQSVTIRQSTSLWRGSDSGEEVAHHLGLDCATYDRTARQYPLEEAIWAVAGRASILNWTLFDYPQPLCLFFTGSYGDKMWSRKHGNTATRSRGQASRTAVSESFASFGASSTARCRSGVCGTYTSYRKPPSPRSCSLGRWAATTTAR